MFHIRKLIMLGMVATLSVTAMGCGKNNTTNEKEQTSKAESMVTEEVNESTSKEEEFSDRVVATSVAAVSILDALGIPMVGVPTSSYELPESVSDATRIGNAMSPDLEIVASLEPTVVISVDSLSEDLKSQFDTLGIESTFANLSSYDGLKESIKSLGERFKKEEKATALLESLAEKEDAITAKIEGKASPNVLVIFGAGSTFMVASETSYVGDLVKRVGGTNIVKDVQGSFVSMDMEYLADKDPDYILLMAHANPEESLAALKEEFEVNEAWKNFTAVQKNQVYALDTNYFGMSANLLAVDAMEKLVEIIYAE